MCASQPAFARLTLSKGIAVESSVPFTVDGFLDVFAAYNEALWPFAAVLWLVTAGVFAAFVAGRPQAPNAARILLAGHWLWSGVMYHAFFFTAINPAAWVFAALFVVQGALLAGWPPSPPAGAARPGSARRIISTALIAYGVAYPLVVWADGFVYPRMPTFGVPCPTVVLTIGFLVAVSTRSFVLSLVPIAWSLLGLSAVRLFGIHADAVLPVAGAMLAGDLILRRSHVMKKLSFASLLAVVVMMFAGLPPATAFAQTPQHDHAQQAQKGGMKMDQMKTGDMKMMEEMAAKQKANTERINALMATVKSATGEKKVAALADVISVLLEERAAMQEHCAAMMKMMHGEVKH